MVRNVGHDFFAGPKISPTPTNDNFQDQNSMVNSQFWGLLRRCFLGAKMVPPLSHVHPVVEKRKNTQPPISKCNWVTAKAAKVYVSDRLKNHLRCASVRCALKDPSAVPSASPVHYADSTRQIESGFCNLEFFGTASGQYH